MPMFSANGVFNSSLPDEVKMNAALPAVGFYDASGDSVMSSIQPLIDYITGNQNQTNVYNSAEAAEQRRFQADQASLDRAFNADQAAINRDWQEMMSNTAHQREVRDLLAAGLNPVLSASGGNGASTGSGATASMQSTPNGAKATAGNVNSALVSLFGTLLDNQTKLMMSMNSGYATNSYYDTQLALAAMKREWELEDRAYNKEYYAWQQELLKQNQIDIANAKPGTGIIGGALQGFRNWGTYQGYPFLASGYDLYKQTQNEAQNWFHNTNFGRWSDRVASNFKKIFSKDKSNRSSGKF